MASGVMYQPSSSSWDYGVYPLDDHRPDYALYASSRPPPQYAQHHQVHQIWTPSRMSVGSYPDSSFLGSPPPLRRSLANDSAFAPDPNTNPDHWYRRVDAQSTTPFPTGSHSALDLPHGFVPQSGIIPSTSHRAHSYHEDVAGKSSAPNPVYFVPASVSSSSSTSDSSASNSSFNRLPPPSVRSSAYPHEHLDSPFRSIQSMETPYTLPDEAQSHPRNRRKRRSPHAARQANDQAEEASGTSGATFPSVDQSADGSSHTLVSSITVPSPPGLAEQPKNSRRRNSSRPTPPDLDPIDELDKTNPYGINVHHKGPYEAVAAILNETNPIDSPLLRAKGIQQQVSASALVRPSRHTKSEPNVNPMSLNLQPGQILQHSMYQPTQPTHFPVEFSQGASRPPRQVEITAAEYDTANARPPLRRNQTLPAPGWAHGPPEQPYPLPHSVISEVQMHQRPYPADSNVHQPNPPPSFPVDGENSVPSHSSGRSSMSRTPPEPPYAPLSSHSLPSQPASIDHGTTHHPPYASHNSRPTLQVAPGASITPPDAPPTPDIDQRLMRTLYLTNPDEAPGAPGHHSREPPLPPAPVTVHPSERPSERPPRSHHNSFYDGQTSLTTARAPTERKGRRRVSSHFTPSSTSTTSDKDSPRRYEPPSQTVAALKGQYVGQAASVSSSSSSSRTSSLAPRHIPKRLVMPSPLASATESALPTVPSAATSMRPNNGRPGQLLRKRSTPAGISRPQRAQTLPSQTVNRGVFSFFRFGKGSKPTVREVRVAEQQKVGMSEKGRHRVHTREEPRKLSKRK